ncbi:hypothetical protein BJX68DRAFT_273718 [Aspergillus pseudodeflectus]|uniref:Uncharacterized protein n=1 Tax=Aspergillus pseudodeflectus TaxID=176178 RepID=A0ABR4J6Q2_9EURO
MDRCLLSLLPCLLLPLRGLNVVLVILASGHQYLLLLLPPHSSAAPATAAPTGGLSPTPQAAITAVQLARAIHEDGDVRGLRVEYREYLAPPPLDTPRSQARAINYVVILVISPALAALRAYNKRTPSLALSSLLEEATSSMVLATELVGVF